MENEGVLAVLGCFGVLFAILWHMSIQLIKKEIAETVASGPDLGKIIESIPAPTDILAELKDELADLMQDLVESTLGNMEMPSAIDHLTGFAMNFMQHKMMSVVPEPLAEMIPSFNEGEVDSD